MIQNLSQQVLLLWGWKRLAVAIAAGGVAALSMPPLNAMPVLALAFPVAVWLIDGATAGPGRFSWPTLKAAFSAGWGFGFGYFLVGFWWLGAAFLVEDDGFIWAMPLGVVGLPAALALFHGFGFLIARLFWSTGSRRIFAFAAGMATVEWLRSFILTGFPWNSIGQALAGFDATAQMASVVGLQGLTILALLIFSAPATLGSGETAGQRWRMPVLAFACLAGITGFGLWRLQANQIAMLPDVKIRIMQPNLSQREKHRMNGQEVLTRYLKLSDRATTPGVSGIADVTHLVWPESPFPFLLAREPQALAQISGLLKPRTILITGAARAEDAVGANGKARYFNSMHVVGPDGVITDSYDKTHLVPFGEYLPFSEWFGKLGIRQFIEIPGGFEAGLRRKPIAVKGFPVTLPLICYEAIFPAELLAWNSRPALFLNVTNDGWFGITSGPHQHFAQARLRTIEFGVPLVRAANTGISAIIDPLGRIVSSLPLGVEGVVDGPLPSVLKNTIYSGVGDVLAILLLIFSFGLCIRAK
ncbi:MAG: apolipoprotein N-acyltransferase [Beijerinckiaceae bacterium]